MKNHEDLKRVVTNKYFSTVKRNFGTLCKKVVSKNWNNDKGFLTASCILWFFKLTLIEVIQNVVSLKIPFSEKSYFIESSHSTCTADQLTGFYRIQVITERNFRTDRKYINPYSTSVSHEVLYFEHLLQDCTKHRISRSSYWKNTLNIAIP